MTHGALTVVGLGIAVPGHVTYETLARLQAADEVLYLVTDPLAASWIDQVNPNTRSLQGHYEHGKELRAIYRAIADDVLARLRQGGNICLAFYGHPGVFVYPTRLIITNARNEGFSARMLPAVSAEDCLFADLEVDPAEAGCQSYEATDLVVNARAVDSSSPLIIWQPGMIANVVYARTADVARLSLLIDYLERFYGSDHEVVCYEASPYPICGPAIQRVRLADLADAEITKMTSIYVPPAVHPECEAVTRGTGSQVDLTTNAAGSRV